MNELKPCPFCGTTPDLLARRFGLEQFDRYGIKCEVCHISLGWDENLEELKTRWNRRVSLETAFYDLEETIPNCTVQILRNSITGEVSVGWWRQDDA